jgi:hypothetical protein
VKETEDLLVLRVPFKGRAAVGFVLLAASATLVLTSPDFSWEYGHYVSYLIAAGMAYLALRVLLWQRRVVVYSDPPRVALERRLGPIPVDVEEHAADQLECVGLTGVRREDPRKRSESYALAGGIPWHWEFSGFVVIADGATVEFSSSSDLDHEKELSQKVAAHLGLPLRTRVPEDVQQAARSAFSDTVIWLMISLVIGVLVVLDVLLLN